MRGPPPTPTAILRARGSPRADRRKLEPKPAAGEPTCPAHLKGIARTCWKRMAGILTPMGLLTIADGEQLALYCQAYARWIKAEAQIATDGVIVKSPNGYPIQHPALSVANGAMKQMSGYLAKFGMTPADRARVVTAAPEKKRPERSNEPVVLRIAK